MMTGLYFLFIFLVKKFKKKKAMLSAILSMAAGGAGVDTIEFVVSKSGLGFL